MYLVRNLANLPHWNIHFWCLNLNYAGYRKLLFSSRLLKPNWLTSSRDFHILNHKLFEIGPYLGITPPTCSPCSSFHKLVARLFNKIFFFTLWPLFNHDGKLVLLKWNYTVFIYSIWNNIRNIYVNRVFN